MSKYFSRSRPLRHNEVQPYNIHMCQSGSKPQVTVMVAYKDRPLGTFVKNIFTSQEMSRTDLSHSGCLYSHVDRRTRTPPRRPYTVRHFRTGNSHSRPSLQGVGFKKQQIFKELNINDTVLTKVVPIYR